MKKILTILFLGSINFAFASSLQDSTQNQNREQEQKQIQEQNQQKNQGEETQIRDRNSLHSGNEIPNNTGKIPKSTGSYCFEPYLISQKQHRSL